MNDDRAFCADGWNGSRE